jgi:hypothetical protein
LKHFLSFDGGLSPIPQEGYEVVFRFSSDSVQVFIPFLFEDIAIFRDQSAGEKCHLTKFIMRNKMGVLQLANVWLDVDLAV